MRLRARSVGWTRRALACAVVGLAGCSLFVSLDDLSGGASTSSPDASIDGGGFNDASTADAIAIDTGASPDSAICAGFCDNFDDRSTPIGAWDAINQFGDGDPANVSISSAEFLSPPQSVHFHVPAKSATPAGGVYLLKQLPLNAAKISIDFDMKIVPDISGFDGYANLMEVSFNDNYAGSITIGGGANVTTDYWVQFPDGGHVQSSFAVVPHDDQSWHHVHYVALYDPANGSFFVTWDNGTVANVSSTVTYAFTPVPSTIGLTLGYTSQPHMPAMDVYYDNVQVQ